MITRVEGDLYEGYSDVNDLFISDEFPPLLIDKFGESDNDFFVEARDIPSVIEEIDGLDSRESTYEFFVPSTTVFPQICTLMDDFSVIQEGDIYFDSCREEVFAVTKPSDSRKGYTPEFIGVPIDEDVFTIGTSSLTTERYSRVIPLSQQFSYPSSPSLSEHMFSSDKRPISPY